MHDDIAEAFGLAPLGSHQDGTHHGHAVEPDGDERWRDQAACHPRHKPDDMTIADWVNQWFPPQGGRVEHLRDICAACPALEPCQADALSRNDLGFQGGLTQRERQRRRKPRPESHNARLVARYVEMGWTDERIGRRIGITTRGVQYHRRQLGIVKDNHGRIVAHMEGGTAA